MVNGVRQRNDTISGPAYATVGPSFMHYVVGKNFGSTGNLETKQVSRRSSLGPVLIYIYLAVYCRECGCVHVDIADYLCS